MIYLKLAIVAENKKRFLELLAEAKNTIIKDFVNVEKFDTTSIEVPIKIHENEGYTYVINEDPCWDYETPIEKHLDLLL